MLYTLCCYLHFFIINRAFVYLLYIYIFSRFPRDVEKRDKWLKTLNLENYNPPKTVAVCSAHFKEENYE